MNDARGPSLTVLLTNLTLASRTGTELYVYDVARGLLAAGHRPIVYSPSLGEIAGQLRALSIPVTDSLERLSVTPDIIHGHHNVTTLAALARFPTTPAVGFIHDALSWHDVLSPIDRLRVYVAVDETCRDRLVFEQGIPEARVRILPNAVDLTRFRRRTTPLPVRPKRALVFSNYARADAENRPLDILRAACDAEGIALDIVGSGVGNSVSAPEEILGNYDLVFGKARCVLEALCAGCAALVCDQGKVGGLVTTANMAAWRGQNFGRRTLQGELTVERVRDEIRRYEAVDAARVCDLARESFSLERLIDDLVATYRDAIAGFDAASIDLGAERTQMSRALEALARAYVEQGGGLWHRVLRAENELAWLRRERGSWLPWRKLRSAGRSLADRVPALRPIASRLRRRLVSPDQPPRD